jgi:proline iminopeptidase
MSIRGVSMFVDVIGRGYPLLLMHGGPGLDHWSLMPFRRCADQFTLVFYDHRCNGRSEGAPVTSMTWENLTADADSLRHELGFEKWAVLGHSFGGHVALEYALRYPDRISHLVLLDTGADCRWSRDNAPAVLARRGYKPEAVEAVRRFFSGDIAPNEMVSTVRKFGRAYYSHPSLLAVARDLIGGEIHTKMRPEALIFAGQHLLNGWTVVDRLGQIKVPTLVMAGADDFLYPPECQAELMAGLPNARLRLIEGASHNPQTEQPAEVFAALREFLRSAVGQPVQALGGSNGLISWK